MLSYHQGVCLSRTLRNRWWPRRATPPGEMDNIADHRERQAEHNKKDHQWLSAFVINPAVLSTCLDVADDLAGDVNSINVIPVVVLHSDGLSFPS